MPDLAGEKILYLSYVGLIDAAGVGKLVNAINTAVNQQFEKVYLCICSQGGYVGEGIFLYNHILGLPIPVVMHNTGNIASIATTIFCAGKERYCTANSVFMIHPVFTGLSNGASHGLTATLDALTKDEERIDDILRTRTKITKKVLQNRRRTEVYLAPDKALEMGLVGEIRDFSLPTGNKIFHV